MQKEFVIGVISDTHGLLRPEALAALKGSRQIIHAGDIGSPEIIPALRSIGPVTAVRGNVDSHPWTWEFAQSEAVEVGGVSIFVLHDLQQLDLNPANGRFQAVISGHTHRPARDVRDGVLYFNPGSAGPRRFTLPVSVGKLVVKNGAIQGRIIELAV